MPPCVLTQAASLSMTGASAFPFRRLLLMMSRGVLHVPYDIRSLTPQGCLPLVNVENHPSQDCCCPFETTPWGKVWLPEYELGMCLQGYAVKTGMLAARGKMVLFMDADGATKVSDIEKLEASLQVVATGNENDGMRFDLSFSELSE